MSAGCPDDGDDTSARLFLVILDGWDLFLDVPCTKLKEGIADAIETLGITPILFVDRWLWSEETIFETPFCCE